MRLQNNGGGGVNMRGRPLGQRWVENESSDWQVDHMCADCGVILHPLSAGFTQTNQRTCVLTPKSQSLTCPRVFTSILDGLTSAETNYWIELQPQQLGSLPLSSPFYYLNTQTTRFLTHLYEVFSGSTDTSGLWLPTDTSKKKKLKYTIIQGFPCTCGWMFYSLLLLTVLSYNEER